MGYTLAIAKTQSPSIQDRPFLEHLFVCLFVCLLSCPLGHVHSFSLFIGRTSCDVTLQALLRLQLISFSIQKRNIISKWLRVRNVSRTWPQSALVLKLQSPENHVGLWNFQSFQVPFDPGPY